MGGVWGLTGFDGVWGYGGLGVWGFRGFGVFGGSMRLYGF